MDENQKISFRSRNCNLKLSAYPGHYATRNSHINYFLDMTTIKIRQSNAEEAANALVQLYKHNTVVDTIVCLDGTEVIGAFLAEKLTDNGFFSYNKHKSIYIVTPEMDSEGQLFFRNNIVPMVKGRNVVLLMASITTGITVNRSWECIEFYGGKLQGISAIFSAIDEYGGIPINSLFTPQDIPNYHTYKKNDCPYCKKGQKLDALVNGYGYSEIPNR